MSQDSKHKGRSFSDEFKRDAVNLIVKVDGLLVNEQVLELEHRFAAPDEEDRLPQKRRVEQLNNRPSR